MATVTLVRSTPAGPAAPRSRRILPVAVIAVLVGASALAWERLPPLARDTLWAEDGRTFLGQAARPGALSTLVTPYAGYLHTVPRLEALVIAHLVPVAGWALTMTAINCLVAGAVAAIVFVASASVLPWMPARLLLASLTVLTPLASREVLGNAANIHSILFWGAFWMLLARPRSRTAAAVLAAAMLLSALTEIQTLFLLPLVLLRLRDRAAWPLKGALLVGAALQLAATLAAPRPSTSASPDSPLSIAFGWIVNAVLTSWAPRSEISGLVATFGPAVAAVLAIPLASLAVVLARGRRAERVTALLLLAGSIVVWVAGVVLDPRPYYEYASPAVMSSDRVWLARYGVVPAMMLLAITVVAIAVIVRAPRGRAPAVIAAVALVAVLIAQAPTTDTRRSSGPAWMPQIASAEAACATGVPEVRLRETLGWVVAVPCALLRDRITGIPGLTMEPPVGIEPTTYSLRVNRSAD